MKRFFYTALVCLGLSGCASSGMFSSLSTVGGPKESDPPKPTPTASSQPAASADSSSSGIGGIWSNFSSAFSSGEQPASLKSGEKQALDANEALRLVNDYRASNGLPALTLDPHATAAAAALAADMAKHDHMSHFGPNGADVGKRLIAAGYSYSLAAENVGVGQASLNDIVEGWKKSPPHSRNMLLAKAKNMGIAYEYKPGTKFKTFWTLVIAAPQ
jgi:uncharacterized protein YkwD